MERPFYGTYGWAYDDLVAGPVEPWCDAVEAALERRLATILDAGCGTGRHAAELARRGHALVLVDGSPALLEQARQRLPDAPAFAADLRTLRLAARIDAVACRGVLNDFVSDDDRDAVLRALAALLPRDGVLVADVRDREGTRRRYAAGRSDRRTVTTARGTLGFESEARYRRAASRLRAPSPRRRGRRARVRDAPVDRPRAAHAPGRRRPRRGRGTRQPRPRGGRSPAVRRATAVSPGGARAPAAKVGNMRNRTLHASLRDFAEQAAFQLEADAANGAEIPFEVVETPGARAPLYCYRPLTGQFIRDRLGVLGRLPTYGRAKQAIEALGGVDAYLRVRGEPRVPEDAGERADAALRSFLAAMYAESSEFEFSAERFARAYSELEAAVYETRALSTVIVPLHGLELVSDEVPIVEGLSLVRGDSVPDAPAEAVWGRPEPSDVPNALVSLTSESAPGDPPPLAQARARSAALLTALRLVDAGGFALGASAWARTDAGPWRLVALGVGGGLPSGPGYRVEPDEEDELRGFCNLVARRAEAARGEVAFALRRFEMGCERADPFDTLTDHLLALRALLEPEGAHSGRLAQRLAAICAMPEQRAALAERTAHAISLERALVGGLEPATPDARALVADTAHHLRALLRDVLCGHLDEDLVAVADALLAEASTAERDAALF